MKDITLYLEKFKEFGFKDQILKQKIIQILEEKFNISLERGNIEINREGVVTIRVSGAQNSELFINKDSIQKEIIKNLGKSDDSFTKLR
jgi:hypothetical protein